MKLSCKSCRARLACPLCSSKFTASPRSFVCVCVRERERVSMCVWERERGSEIWSTHERQSRPTSPRAHLVSAPETLNPNLWGPHLNPKTRDRAALPRARQVCHQPTPSAPNPYPESLVPYPWSLIPIKETKSQIVLCTPGLSSLFLKIYSITSKLCVRVCVWERAREAETGRQRENICIYIWIWMYIYTYIYIYKNIFMYMCVCV